MTSKLLEQVYNSYMYFLGELSNGRTDWEYSLIYNALLLIKNDITDKKYIQYYENNLLEPIIYKL